MYKVSKKIVEFAKVAIIAIEKIYIAVEYVCAKFSSSLCPRCGEKLASNEVERIVIKCYLFDNGLVFNKTYAIPFYTSF